VFECSVADIAGDHRVIWKSVLSEQIEVAMRLTVADHGYHVGLRGWIETGVINDGTRKMVNP